MTPAPALIAEAVKTAKATNKTVFVHFGASWCGWCHKLDEFLHSKEIGPIIDANYVLVPLTVQDKKVTPGADSVLGALGLAGGGLPVYAFLDGTGKELATSKSMPNGSDIGYPGLPEEIAAFSNLMKKTAPRMTDAEQTKISDYLTSVAKALNLQH